MINSVKKGSRLKTYACIWIMLAVAIIHFFVFWVYVNIDTIRLTFFEYIDGEFIFCGFRNYVNEFKKIFVDEYKTVEATNMFWNTFRALPINLIILPICIVTAYAFYKKVYGEKVFRVIFYLPSIITIVVQCSAFLAMFKSYPTMDGGVSYGPYAKFFSLFGYTPEWLDKGASSTLMWPLIYAFCIITGLSTNVILMSSAMLRIPSSITEALQLDGCGFYKELFTITLPLIMPTITTWMTALIASVFGFMMQPMLLTEIDKGYRDMYYTIPWFIFDQTAQYSKATIPATATLGIMLSLIVMPIVAIVRWICNKFTQDITF